MKKTNEILKTTACMIVLLTIQLLVISLIWAIATGQVNVNSMCW